MSHRVVTYPFFAPSQLWTMPSSQTRVMMRDPTVCLLISRQSRALPPKAPLRSGLLPTARKAVHYAWWLMTITIKVLFKIVCGPCASSEGEFCAGRAIFLWHTCQIAIPRRIFHLLQAKYLINALIPTAHTHTHTCSYSLFYNPPFYCPVCRWPSCLCL